MSEETRKLVVIGLDGLMPEMVMKFHREGILPSMGALIEEGTFSIMCSDPPVDTMCNWPCLGTGAHVGTHGVQGFATHLPGTPIDATVGAHMDLGITPAASFKLPPGMTRVSELNRAEYLWEAAAKEGKRCVLLEWPMAYPARMDGFRLVNTCGPFCSAMGRLLPPNRFSTIETEEKKGTLTVHFEEAKDWVNLPRSGPVPLACSLLVSGQYPRPVKEVEEGPQVLMGEPPPTGAGRWDPETWGESNDLSQLTYELLLVGQEGSQEYDRLLICRSKDAAQKLAELRTGQWSPWFKEEMEIRAAYRQITAYELPSPYADIETEVMFRFRLLSLSPDGREVVLYRTSLFSLKKWTSPEGLAEELVDGLFQQSQQQGAEGMLGDGLVLEKHSGILGTSCHTSIADQAESTISAAKTLLQDGDWDAFWVQIHSPDGINHQLLTYLDPESCIYRPEVWEEYRAVYRSLDKFVGAITEMCVDENTVVAVVSDHACFPVRRHFWTWPVLAKAGLIGFKENPATGKISLDPTKCKIWSYGNGYLVHDKARYEAGVVDPEDTEAVIEETRAALYSLRDPANGHCPISAVLTLDEASMLGFWGDRCPDIYVALVPGYGSFGSGGEVSKESLDAPAFRDVTEEVRLKGRHGPNLPQSVMKEKGFSSRAVFIFKGPGVKKGYMRPRTSWTVDVVPTLAHLAGLPTPAQCEGRVLTDAIEN